MSETQRAELEREPGSGTCGKPEDQSLPPVRIGVLGLNFGRHIVEQIMSGPAGKWLELVGVCSLEPQRTRDTANRFSLRAYADLDAMLADPQLEAIGLFTGPAGRAELVRRIIRSGKDVLTTKPFELDPHAAEQVLQEARYLSRVVHLNSPSPLLTADLRQILQWQQEMQLGRPVACRADVWASYREKADGGWYDDHDRCPVAPILRLGIYLINDLIRLLGPAHSVQVTHSRLFTGRPTPDNAQLNILFPDGCIASLFASFCVNDGEPHRNALTLNYEHGTVYRNVGPGYMPHKCRLSVVSGHESSGRVSSVELAETSGNYQWDVFCRAVRDRPLPGEVSPQQVANGLRVIRAMARAATSGGAEPVV